MTSPLPSHVWEATPAESRLLIEALLIQVEALRAEVVDLKARLDANLFNLSKPSSTDPPYLKRRLPLPPSGKKCGGQHGHKRSLRPLVPTQQLTGIAECKPSVCPGCGHGLAGDDPEPSRHQVAELPEVRSTVVEDRRHRLTCSQCGKAARGELPAGVPRGAFGPHLPGVARPAFWATCWVRRSPQAWSARPSTPLPRRWPHRLRRSPTTSATPRRPGLDQTGWKPKWKQAWLWVAVTPAATFFRIDPKRGAAALHALVGEPITPVLTCDRSSTYARAPDRRSCWAHLHRDFQAMIDRKAGGEGVGEPGCSARRGSSSRGGVGWSRAR